MRKNEEHRKSMRDRIMAKVNQPRQSKFDYLALPAGFEKFAIDGKVKEIGGKKIVTMRIDIMPYKAGRGNPNCEEGEPYYERTFFIHNVDLGDNNRVKFVCPKKSAGKPCPACEMEAKLRKDPNATKEELVNWASKERQLFNVRDVADPDKVKIWDVAYSLFGKLLEASIAGEDDDECLESFAELKGGKTLRIQCEEKKFGSGKYYEVQKIDFKDRDEDYEASAIDESACLDDMLIIRDYEELNRLLFENNKTEETPFEDEEEASNVKTRKHSDDEDEDEDVLEDKPAKSKVKAVKKAEKDEDLEKSAKSKVKPVPKQAPAEDEDEDEDEEPPKSKTKIKAKVFEDEDEDEEEVAKSKSKPKSKDSEDEDEEEELPKSKAKSSKGDGAASKKCPFGHKFGVDCDKDDCADDCIECELWDACSDAQEAMA